MLENWLYQEVKCDIAMEINHQFAVIPSIDLTISSGRRTSIGLLRSKWMFEKITTLTLSKSASSQTWKSVPPPCRALSAALRFDVALDIFQPEVVSCVTVCGHDSVHTSQLALHVVGVTTEVGQKCLSEGRVVAFRASEVSGKCAKEAVPVADNAHTCVRRYFPAAQLARPVRLGQAVGDCHL